MPKISVIVCTHNPRPDYLARTLEALRSQTLSREQWELLLIDNASKEPLAESVDLSWHPHGRHVREDELGLTPARHRGIREAAGELLVFVDDDNVLDVQYLKCAMEIGEDLPFLGAWGGSCLGEFEEPPDPKLKDFLPYLALLEVTSPQWSNHGGHSIPVGAGLFVRNFVARKYLSETEHSPMRGKFDRRGKSLMGGGDYDLAMTSYALGLGTGVFPQLRLLHLIPRSRLDYEYLYRLCVASVYSSRLANHFHSGGKQPGRVSRSRFAEVIIRVGKRMLLRKAGRREEAAMVGMRMAEEDIACMQQGKPLKWFGTL